MVTDTKRTYMGPRTRQILEKTNIADLLTSEKSSIHNRFRLNNIIITAEKLDSTKIRFFDEENLNAI